MDRQIGLGYLVLEIPEPETLSPVLADVIGLIPGEPADGALTWRDDVRAQRIVVQAGPTNDAVAVGFEAIDAAAFDATVERLRALGAEVVDSSDHDLAIRRVARLARTTAPW